MRALALLLAAAATAPPPPLFSPGGSRHLLADDVLIDSMAGGVGVRQGAAERITPLPVLAADSPWESGCLLYWFNSLLRNPADPGELRCYYYLLCE